MADRPILFSSAMVSALLAGRKTQTRRILKPQPILGYTPDVTASKGVRFAKGDRLWVRETHRVASWDEDGRVWISYAADNARSRALEPPDEDFLERLCAKLDKAGVPTKNNGFYGDDIPENLLRRVSIHMPRWASRLTLAVTDVRVERLQDISDADAVAEGCSAVVGPNWWQGYRDLGHGGALLHQTTPGDAPPEWMIEPKPAGRSAWADKSARDGFRDIWNTINGAGSWAANPWVIALTFAVAHHNIDSAPMPEREEPQP